MRNLKKKLDCIKQAQIDMPVYHDLLGLYRKLLVEKDKFEKTLTLKPIEVDTNFLEKKIKEGFPLFDRRKIPLDTGKLKEHFLKLTSLVKIRNEEGGKKIEAAIKENKISIEEAGRSFLNEKDYLEEKEALKLDAELFLFLTGNALLPFLEIYSEQLEHHLKGFQWNWGHCPICGGRAKIAELRGEEGRRFLLCSLCNHEWQFSRIRCPFCNNGNQEKLSYFTIDGKEGFRVDLCMECKDYIKTLDSRKLNRDIILEIDDIATLHLDILAQKEGFKKSGFAEINLGEL